VSWFRFDIPPIEINEEDILADLSFIRDRLAHRAAMSSRARPSHMW
jgi:hypothetical protein